MIKLKKLIVILFLITLVVCVSKNESKVLIPSDAIRFRIIANSNTLEDQTAKYLIKTEIEPILANILKSSNNHDDTKKLINENMSKIEQIIDKHNIDYSINYGNNYFPEKTYKGIHYKEGNYESLVITLGEGIGDNWWCVLFPPLCLLEASVDDYDEVTYTTYIKEIIDKFS